MSDAQIVRAATSYVDALLTDVPVTPLLRAGRIDFLVRILTETRTKALSEMEAEIAEITKTLEQFHAQDLKNRDYFDAELKKAEAENARLRDALKDAAEELREIVSWTVTEKSKLRAQELDQIAVTQGKIRAALKAEGGEK